MSKKWLKGRENSTWCFQRSLKSSSKLRYINAGYEVEKEFAVFMQLRNISRGITSYLITYLV